MKISVDKNVKKQVSAQLYIKDKWMEQKQTNKKPEGLNPLIHTALLLIGMMAVGFISFYLPMMIFALLIFAPFALSIDMKQSVPVLSIGLLAVSAISLYFNDFNYALYIILTVSTGMSSLLCFAVWKFFNIKRFSDGFMYSIFAAVLFGIIAALVVFIVRDRQPFAEEIVISFESWLRNADSVTIEYFYRYYKIGSALTLAESQQALWAPIEGLTETEMISSVMPYMQSAVNQFSLSAMVIYPAFIGIITWWRGNARFYKNQPIDEENMELKPKPFSTFAMPRWLFTAVVVMVMLSLLAMISDYGEVIFNAGVLIQNFAYILFTVQGLAVLEYFLKRNAVLKHTFLRIIVLALILLLSGGLIPIFIGGADILLNIRVVYVKAQELKIKMQRDAEKNKNNENKDQENDDK